MKRILNIESWPRKDHFNFFKQFEEPFFGVCVPVNCSRAYADAKETGNSFFLTYLHKSLVAANRTEPFRYRIAGEQVIIYDTVDASATINRPDGTMGFSYMKYDEDFGTFKSTALAETERVRNSSGLIPAISGENVIHFSSVPWINFTSLSHARSFSFNDSCPKISFGKMTDSAGEKTMPVSIHVHHALMDGFHVAQFIDEFQRLMNE